jgi:hypothetical protein
VNGVEDPGWGAVFRAAFPYRDVDGLTVIRTPFIAALLPFVASLPFVIDGEGDAGIVPLTVVGTGLIGHFAIGFLGRRPLATGSPEALADSWRTRFFLEVDFAEFPGLAGVAGAIISDAFWVYPVGLAFALVGLWRIAPSRRNVTRDQAAIRLAGSSLDLVGALITMGPFGSARRQGPAG